MRRLGGLVIAAVAILSTLAMTSVPAAADDPPPCPPEGCDPGAVVNPGDDSADVWASDGSDLGDPTATRSGGSDVACEFTGMTTGLAPNRGVWMVPINWDYLQNPPETDVGKRVGLYRQCSDGSSSIVWVTLPVTAPPAADPLQLALLARRQLPFPLPVVSFAPPLAAADDFLLTRLEAWLWVENWGAVSRTATAGTVWATVTATPVRQVWDFDAGSSDPSLEGGCDSGGVAWDPSRRADEQWSPCTFTFVHSSAGQLAPYPDAFEARLSVVYEITWTSSIPGQQGSLGTVTRTAVRPVRVGEQQALND